jgi:hypothetical protein
MTIHRPEWTRTVRFRLTLTYSLLLFGLAALVVGGIYWGLANSLDAQPVAKTFDVAKQYRGITVERFTAADVSDVERVVNYNTLRTLRFYSAGTLGGLFAGSLLIGWWLSGRALRPVSRITAAAREIGATPPICRGESDCPARTTSCAGWPTRSTACSAGWTTRSPPSAGSSTTLRTSCATRWPSSGPTSMRCSPATT